MNQKNLLSIDYKVGRGIQVAVFHNSPQPESPPLNFVYAYSYFKKGLSESIAIVDTGTERNFGYSHND